MPYQVALILKQVGYPITCWYEEFQQQQGLKDPYIIPYLGGKFYTWITKDDVAKREHEREIRTAQISVIWLSGLERPANKPKQNYITVKDLHRMLTEKLDDIGLMVANSNKPQYFTLRMTVNSKPRLTKTTLEEFFHNV
ncbi:MAG: hypothetical protein MUO97_10845 [Dehalococcoidia bacterium]|nr:hypothetical protein [Dehalococcoidia bacterium]